MGPKNMEYSFFSRSPSIFKYFTFRLVFNKCEMIKSARYPKIAIWYSLKKHRIKRMTKKWCRVQYECTAC